ncbi:MAG: DUF4265 domain-containing protein [Actinomycetota bacterium]|nr:DUF4265 domain-containing protein [Actinomycetota bacterium]
MMSEQNSTDADTIRVAAPVIDADVPVCSEVMHALPDPSDPDQAILIDVPVLVGGVNFGDIVRLAPEDDSGVRRIVEVVVASGHVHMLVAVDEGEAPDLIAELDRMFPSWALRTECASPAILSISVHPHLDAAGVRTVIADWLAEDSDNLDEHLAMTFPCVSELGAVAWV